MSETKENGRRSCAKWVQDKKRYCSLLPYIDQPAAKIKRNLPPRNMTSAGATRTQETVLEALGYSLPSCAGQDNFRLAGVRALRW